MYMFILVNLLNASFQVNNIVSNKSIVEKMLSNKNTTTIYKITSSLNKYM